MLSKGFAKKLFGGKKEDVGYTPPPLPSQATWLSDTAGSPAPPAPSSEATGGGSKLGLGTSRNSWAAGAGDTQLDESRREQEQHLWEQQQLEEALRISKEMAKQSAETRSAAAATATSAITGVRYEAEKPVPAAHGLFAGLSVGSAPNAAAAERGGPSEADPRSSTGLRSDTPAAAGSEFSFLNIGGGGGTTAAESPASASAPHPPAAFTSPHRETAGDLGSTPSQSFTASAGGKKKKMLARRPGYATVETEAAGAHSSPAPAPAPADTSDPAHSTTAYSRPDTLAGTLPAHTPVQQGSIYTLTPASAAAARVCTNCHTEMNIGANFCTRCGQKAAAPAESLAHPGQAEFGGGYDEDSRCASPPPTYEEALPTYDECAVTSDPPYASSGVSALESLRQGSTAHAIYHGADQINPSGTAGADYSCPQTAGESEGVGSIYAQSLSSSIYAQNFEKATSSHPADARAHEELSLSTSVSVYAQDVSMYAGHAGPYQASAADQEKFVGRGLSEAETRAVAVGVEAPVRATAEAAEAAEEQASREDERNSSLKLLGGGAMVLPQVMEQLKLRLAADEQALATETSALTRQQAHMREQRQAVATRLRVAVEQRAQVDAAQVAAQEREEYEVAEELVGRSAELSEEVQQLERARQQLTRGLDGLLDRWLVLQDRQADLWGQCSLQMERELLTRKGDLRKETEALHARETQEELELQQQLDDVQHTLQHLRFDTEKLSQERKLMEEALASHTAVERVEIEELERERDRVRAEVQEAQRLLQRLQEEDATLGKRLDAAGERMRQASESFAPKLEALEQRQRIVSGRESECQAHKAKVAAAQAELHHKRTHAEQQQAAMIAVVEEAAACAASTRSSAEEHSAMARQLEQSAIRRRALVQEEDAALGAVARIRQDRKVALAARETSAQQMLRVQHEVLRMRSELAVLDAQLPEKEAHKKLAVSAKNFKEASRLSSEIKALLAQRDGLDVKMSSDNARLQQLQATLTEHDKQHADASEQLTSAEENAAALRMKSLKWSCQHSGTARAQAAARGDADAACEWDEQQNMFEAELADLLVRYPALNMNGHQDDGDGTETERGRENELAPTLLSETSVANHQGGGRQASAEGGQQQEEEDEDEAVEMEMRRAMFVAETKRLQLEEQIERERKEREKDVVETETQNSSQKMINGERARGSDATVACEEESRAVELATDAEHSQNAQVRSVIEVEEARQVKEMEAAWKVEGKQPAATGDEQQKQYQETEAELMSEQGKRESSLEQARKVEEVREGPRQENEERELLRRKEEERERLSREEDEDWARLKREEEEQDKRKRFEEERERLRREEKERERLQQEAQIRQARQQLMEHKTLQTQRLQSLEEQLKKLVQEEQYDEAAEVQEEVDRVTAAGAEIDAQLAALSPATVGVGTVNERDVELVHSHVREGPASAFGFLESSQNTSGEDDTGDEATTRTRSCSAFNFLVSDSPIVVAQSCVPDSAHMSAFSFLSDGGQEPVMSTVEHVEECKGSSSEASAFNFMA